MVTTKRVQARGIRNEPRTAAHEEVVCSSMTPTVDDPCAVASVLGLITSDKLTKRAHITRPSIP